MIAERLEPDKIVFGLNGDFSQAIDRLCKRSALPNLAERFHAKTANRDNDRYSHIGGSMRRDHNDR